jgi:hypothetical protein
MSKLRNFTIAMAFLDIGPGRTRLYMPVSEIEKVLPSARREAREQHVEAKGTDVVERG